MTAPRDVDRQLEAFLLDGPTTLPDPSFDAVRDRVEGTRQRVVIGPWRLPDMHKLVPFAVGAVAVVAILLVGGRLLPVAPGGTVGGAPAPTQTRTPTAAPTAAPSPSPTPRPSPSASPVATPPPLTQTFTSAVHGFSMSYPEGWIARPATQPWTDLPGTPPYLHPGFDVLDGSGGSGELFLWITTRPIGKSTPEDWVAGMMAEWECTASDAITVDGVTGRIGADGCHEQAAFATAGRGYEIALYTPNSGERRADPTYDRAWFESVLASVQFHPEDAVKAASSAAP